MNETHPSLYWQTQVLSTASATTMNTAIKNAAIAVAVGAGFGPIDANFNKIVILGGAVE